MKRLDVTDINTPEEFPLPTLKPGMCIVLWTDKGPGGVCGQSMCTTCPWAGLCIFPSYGVAAEYIERHNTRKGTQEDFRLFVVGEYGTGRMFISVPDDAPPPFAV